MAFSISDAIQKVAEPPALAPPPYSADVSLLNEERKLLIPLGALFDATALVGAAPAV